MYPIFFFETYIKEIIYFKYVFCFSVIELPYKIPQLDSLNNKIFLLRVLEAGGLKLSSWQF